MPVLNRNFNKYPKFRHNLWTQHENEPDIYYLTFSKGLYQVAKDDAENFIHIRPYCTGHNTVEQIALKSGLPAAKICDIVNSLKEINMLHLPIKNLQLLSDSQKYETLLDACRIWREQLAETHLLNKILRGESNRQVVQGWLLETYHYIKHFPDALLAAYNACTQQKLKALLYKYYQQEKGHEKFVEQTLIKTGLTAEEVHTSIPLVSTRLIDFLLKELFTACPPSVLLVASIIEASEADINQKDLIINKLKNNYNFTSDTMNPYFAHVEVDISLGHEQLLMQHIEYINLIPADRLDNITNKIHDIKHAFDLQQLEIEHYYSKRGNYFPRQFVDFYAI